MGVYGGLGAGKGWLKYQFIISTDELSRILSASHCLLLITNSRVPVDYVNTPLAEYIAGFARRLAQPDLDEGAIDLYISLMDSKTRYRWEKVQARRNREEGFKIIDLAEPVVQVRPLYASPTDDSQLWFGVGFDKRYSIWIGLELNFPRVMSLREEGHARLHETVGYCNAQLYDDLRRAIQEITSPARFITPSGEKRTRVRISSEAASQLRQHPGLKRRGLEICQP